MLQQKCLYIENQHKRSIKQAKPRGEKSKEKPKSVCQKYNTSPIPFMFTSDSLFVDLLGKEDLFKGREKEYLQYIQYKVQHQEIEESF